jgi:predicted transcriptional regulator
VVIERHSDRIELSNPASLLVSRVQLLQGGVSECRNKSLQLITQYVAREEKREAFRQDTLKAWVEFRTTGLHVTADEADAWLDQLEQGNDIEPPACHV